MWAGVSEPCILCSNRGHFSRVSAKLRDSESHAVVRCGACGHCQISPLPDAEAEQEFYDSDRQTKNLDERIDLAALCRKKAHDTARRVRFLQERGFKPGASLLDVGSGYGIFLAEAWRRGYLAVGVEISEERRKKAATLTQAPILNVNLMENAQELGSFNVITLFHVVEHLIRPRPLLSRLTGHLSAGGALLVEVPNLDDRMAKLCPRYRRFLWQRAHVSYFNPRGLRKVLEQSGYRRVEIYGLQRYGIGNMLHWIFRGIPQIRDPSFETEGIGRWLERGTKRWLERGLHSDTLMAVARL